MGPQTSWPLIRVARSIIDGIGTNHNFGYWNY